MNNLYGELFEAWKRELENEKIMKLASDFYSRVAEYLHKIKEESRMLDRKTVKARLLKLEKRNVEYMLRELVKKRHEKIIKILKNGDSLPKEMLTVEERKVYGEAFPLAEAYKNFVEDLISGILMKQAEQKHKRVALRFLKETPTIVGVDMKTYGPFKIEDIASLPIENAKILIKQGLAEKLKC
ncbi:hypothetical protein CW708_02135 [Candidatus Bathyarchaeota archaeon]|nr:MAG: hypothetical protein CW708_02135 [Candidatus Bathyarchaeota archaeon]